MIFICNLKKNSLFSMGIKWNVELEHALVLIRKKTSSSIKESKQNSVKSEIGGNLWIKFYFAAILGDIQGYRKWLQGTVVEYLLPHGHRML